jgi:hypothetical protein
MGIDTPFEVAISREHGGRNQIRFLNGFNHWLG